MIDSFFLFAEPSFVEGMARILDMGNTLNVYNESPSTNIADSTALSIDWSLVGKDISNAIAEIREEGIVEEKSE